MKNRLVGTLALIAGAVVLALGTAAGCGGSATGPVVVQDTTSVDPNGNGGSTNSVQPAEVGPLFR